MARGKKAGEEVNSDIDGGAVAEPKEVSDAEHPAAYEMGKIYVAGVDEEEEEQESGGGFSEYQEMGEDEAKAAGKTRRMLSGNSNEESESGDAPTSDADPFYDKKDFDADDWAYED